MRTVGKRQMQMKFYDEVKDLPILVTRENSVTKKVDKVFIVVPFDDEIFKIIEDHCAKVEEAAAVPPSIESPEQHTATEISLEQIDQLPPDVEQIARNVDIHTPDVNTFEDPPQPKPKKKWGIF